MLKYIFSHFNLRALKNPRIAKMKFFIMTVSPPMDQCFFFA